MASIDLAPLSPLLLSTLSVPASNLSSPRLSPPRLPPSASCGCSRRGVKGAGPSDFLAGFGAQGRRRRVTRLPSCAKKWQSFRITRRHGRRNRPFGATAAGRASARANQGCHGQAVIPASSKAIRFPLRTGKGSFGTRCLVKAKHFITQLPDKDLHHYDVSITPEVTSRVVTQAVINELVNLHRASGGRLPAYDDRKSLYTAGPSPFTSKEFQITLLDSDDGSGS